MLKVLEKAEIFEEHDGDPKYVHTTVVCEDADGFFVTFMNCALREVPETLYKSPELLGFKVLPDDVFPSIDDLSVTKVTPHSSDRYYVKRQSLLSYKPGDDTPKKLMLHEIHVMETLKQFEHPNIAKYNGCLEQGNRLVGLCFEKYSETLAQRVRREDNSLDIDRCLNGIRSGIVNLHSLGYCHNDINPSNIMFSEDGTPVIIDYDSCMPTGRKLGLKFGTPFFSDEDATHSEPENDYYSLRLVKEYLENRET